MKKAIEFIGTPSGNGECFCWDVDKENYVKVKNKKPDKYDYLDAKFEFQGSEYVCIYLGDRIGLYPNDIFAECIYDKQGKIINIIYPQKKMKIKIEFEEIE